MHNALDILQRLCGQSHHEVELYHRKTAGKGDACGAHQFLFADIFVDDIPEPLCACLGCKGKAALPHALDAFHQFPGEVVHPERGQRDVDAVFIQIRQQIVQCLFQAAVIAGTQ